MWRTLAERLSRGRVIKRRIRVNDKTASVFVSPDAQLKYLRPGKTAFDQDLIQLACSQLRTDSNVWDIGANMGVFTFAAATVAPQGTIVAVEADIWLAGILRKTAGLEEYRETNICILPAAVAETNSVATFLIARRGRASNALETAGGRSQMGGIRERQFVPTITLDSLLDVFPAPDFVKIDIEGGELPALRGASKLLADVRPTIYAEVGKAPNDVSRLLQSAGYAACTIDGTRVEDEWPYNVLFVPD